MEIQNWTWLQNEKNVPVVWMVGWKVRGGDEETTVGKAVEPTTHLSLVKALFSSTASTAQRAKLGQW